jgi:hypothetical protein
MAQPVPISGNLARRTESYPQQQALSPYLERRTEILAELTKFSLRRMAAVNTETLALFTEDLAIYEPADVAEALDKFGKSIPGQYEAAFPCVGVFIQKIESVVNQRKRAERERKEKLDEEEKARLREEEYRLDPERHAREEREFQEKVEALNKKLGIPNNLKPKANLD